MPNQTLSLITYKYKQQNYCTTKEKSCYGNKQCTPHMIKSFAWNENAIVELRPHAEAEIGLLKQLNKTMVVTQW